MAQKRILLIAGSDSSGGAGLEADQKVLAAHGCYAMTATTALTAQNTLGVRGIHHTPPAFVRAQIDAVFEDVGVDVVKIGMLASADTTRLVADSLRKYKPTYCVVDPVMVATTGARLLPLEAIDTLRVQLLPLASILTPNIPEAQMLIEDTQNIPSADCEHAGKLSSIEGLIRLAEAVQRLGSDYVLLKGGHLPFSSGDGRSSGVDSKQIVNVLHGNGITKIFKTDFIESENTHGTGCSLASAIASNLALGMSIDKAIESAIGYVEAGIRTSHKLGAGKGPINHLHSVYSLPFAPGRFIEYLLNHPAVQGPWRQHTEHNFVAQLADGTLPLESFQNYLIQDYLFLVQYSRAHALAAYKAKDLDDINASASIVLHIRKEMNLHLEYCKKFGLTREEVENEEESQACTAYTRYVLDVGHTEDWLALHVALAPCLIGYGVIARRLYDNPGTKRNGNVYWDWIENYVADDYVVAVQTGSELLERLATKQSPSRIEDLVRIFAQATKMEAGFWDMGSRPKPSLS